MIVPALLLLSSAGPDSIKVVLPGADLYPTGAAGVEGDVRVRLSIAADGSLRCSIPLPNSRLLLLERPSCELIARRDVFAPGFDRAGHATAATLDLIVRWRSTTDNRQFGGAVPVGRDYWVRHFDHPYIHDPSPPQGKVRVGFDVTVWGRVEHCAVERTSRNASLDHDVCPLLEKRALLLPAIDAAGEPVRTRGWFNVDWRTLPLSDDFSEDGGP